MAEWMKVAPWVLCLGLAACGDDGPAIPQDSGSQDSGMHDAGMQDSGMHDAGMHDGGSQDSGIQDAGMQDAGMQDAGSPCANETLSVVNGGSTSWIIDGGAPDRALTLCRGFTYTFQVNASGHPFAIHTSAGVTSTTNRYVQASGLTGQGVQSGNLVFTPGAGAPATLHYQCEAHAAMTGVLTIVDP